MHIYPNAWEWDSIKLELAFLALRASVMAISRVRSIFWDENHKSFEDNKQAQSKEWHDISEQTTKPYMI